MLSFSIIPPFLCLKKMIDDTLSVYKGWLMNNIDPNITLGYRDVMLVTNGGRRIGYNCCKYASPWDMLSKSSIALVSVTILFVRLLFLSWWSFWNLARQVSISPLQKCKQRVGMATRIMHYSMLKWGFTAAGGRASTHNGILDWWDMLVKQLQYFYVFYRGIQFLPNGRLQT